MAGVVKKLLQKLPDRRIITCLNHQNPVTPLCPPAIQQTKLDPPHSLLQNPTSNCSTVERFAQKNEFQIYPSFSFGHFLNPISSCGLKLNQSQSLEVKNLDLDESRIIWADSVKKKRKRKMNKHKLRKLRKRLRGYS